MINILPPELRHELFCYLNLDTNLPFDSYLDIIVDKIKIQDNVNIVLSNESSNYPNNLLDWSNIYSKSKILAYSKKSYDSTWLLLLQFTDFPFKFGYVEYFQGTLGYFGCCSTLDLDLANDLNELIKYISDKGIKCFNHINLLFSGIL